MQTIAHNLELVKARIDAAAKRGNRDPDSILLVAVSKTKPAPAIREAYAAGQRTFGENYAQELRDKAEELKGLDISWHFIGHLQKNKVKYVAPVASFVETVDSIELAETISNRATKTISCLIEINIGAEDSKSGTSPDNVLSLAEGISKLPNLSLKGLMIIPPFDSDPEKSRPYFKKAKELFDKINEQLATPLTELSMGMSHDLEVAIEEGATIIRVGTAIFGGRS